MSGSKDALQREPPRHPPVCLQTALRTPLRTPLTRNPALPQQRQSQRSCGKGKGGAGFSQPRQGEPFCFQLLVPSLVGPSVLAGVGAPSLFSGSLCRSACSFPSSWGWELVLAAHEGPQDPFLIGYSQLYLLCDHCWQNSHVRPVLPCDTTCRPPRARLLSPLWVRLLSTAACSQVPVLAGPVPHTPPGLPACCTAAWGSVPLPAVDTACLLTLQLLSWGSAGPPSMCRSSALKLAGPVHAQSCELITTVSSRTFFLPKTMSQPTVVTPCHWQWRGAVSQGLRTGASRDTPQVSLCCSIPSQDWRLLCPWADAFCSSTYGWGCFHLLATMLRTNVFKLLGAHEFSFFLDVL